MLSDHCQGVIKLCDLTAPWNSLRSRLVKARESTPENWRGRDRRRLHSRQFNIHAVDRRTVYLAGHIEPFFRGADDLERFRIFERNVVRNWKLGGLIGQFAVREPTISGGINDVAGICSQRRRPSIPFLSGSCDQHGSRRGAYLPQWQVECANRCGTARYLLVQYSRIPVELIVRRSMLYCDAFHIDVE